MNAKAQLIWRMSIRKTNYGNDSKVDRSLKQIRQMRKKAAHRKRRIVFHSDGMSMGHDKSLDQYVKQYEPGEIVLPYLPGTQTDACTYSLMHQFNVPRFYRSNVAPEWPEGAIEKLYGTGPDGLEKYIAFCHENNYEAFWAMRMNDTHDAGSDAHGMKRWKSNAFKQAHPELLVGSREEQPPHGRWSSVDYTHPEVREQAYQIWEEVCKNFDIDGIKLDVFRHPTFFKRVAWGEPFRHPTFFKRVAWGEPIRDEELESMTDLIRRTREMMDRIGTERGRPILLAIRAPDSTDYCREIGLDLERWMAEGLIDIWIATGYFRLNEWEHSVELAHKHGVQHWACLDESRMQGDLPPVEEAVDSLAATKGFGNPEMVRTTAMVRNSNEAFRARALRAWDAGTDAIMVFNFFWKPPDPHFQLLYELGDPKALEFADKMYCVNYRGRQGMQAGYWLKGGERFFNTPEVFSPENPRILRPGQTEVIDLRVVEDVPAGHGNVRLCIQVEGLSRPGDLSVTLNGNEIKKGSLSGVWLEYAVCPAAVAKGSNRFELSLVDGSKVKPTLHDLQLWIRYIG